VQTFKTALVVVLLLTVMYGAYVSLTTPPPDNLEELEGLITDLETLEEGDLGIDDGDGASFAISDGELTAGPAFDMGMPATPSSSAESETETKTQTQTPAIPTGVTESLSDAGGASATEWAAPPSDAAPDMAAPPSLAAAGPKSLPKPSAATPDVQIDPTREYPRTGQASFELPDPASLADASISDASSPQPAEMTGASDPASDAPAAQPDRDASPRPAAAVAASTPETPDSESNTERSSPGNRGLANAIKTTDRLVEADQMKEALATLSVFYNSPDLTPEEREQLLQRLDPLAGEVIYSRRHLLEQPHRVGQNETLMEIAAEYDTPWQLLANITGIEDPVVVLPGTELKVVRGPFRAEVNLARSELTIFLGESYAGRFPIEVGSDPAPQPGTYTVQDKQTAKTYYDATGTPIPPGDKRNPFGDVWLDLGKRMSIHGRSSDGASSKSGCISLRPTDAQDLYAILNQGASVTVQR
jgi:lipoprotein-anchoring transpeptidase ErfK/SrfK